ncbi:amino acid ABC transporter permease [Rhodoligotrophos defluvii]|uniref:amino acid ABC transporter permease n=1 Tax=Rhodoligotrophos defluvii TaxID=2561934 RepID=UPI0010C99EB9|nr:amino acid ABC transporter permease [Rhodoligotrophos defluvii]
MTDQPADKAVLPYVRGAPVAPRPAPVSERGIIGWIHANLFSTWLDALLTLVGLYVVVSVAWMVIDWAILRATWSGANREACLSSDPNLPAGACWAFVRAKFSQWVYGLYPIEERWRVNLVYVIGALALAPMMIPRVPYKRANAVFLLAVYPVLTLILLDGGRFDIDLESWLWLLGLLAAALVVIVFLAKVAGIIDLAPALRGWVITAVSLIFLYAVLGFDFGLRHVETALWGGLLVTLVVAITGMVASLPLGILLALGRRSRLPVVRLFSVMFIELWRGVPLITVLFMASVMLPLFMPEGSSVDKLLRALIGVALFTAAYMAEVIRGGLQAIPKGQYEAAEALGLSYWRKMRLIVLPQALRIVIPGIVNSFISLFKDTTLVSIIGIFDLLGILHAGLADANWSTPQTAATGYFAVALIYWLFCFSISRYSIFMERRLGAGFKR